MNKKEKLEKEIAEAREKLEQLEAEETSAKRNLAIKKLSEYTDEEKIVFFDKMYNSALTELKEREATVR